MDLSHTNCNTVSGDAPCYFRFVSGVLTKGTAVNFEDVNLFKRQILIGDQTVSLCNANDYDKYCNQKTITVIVKWTDFAGNHQSKLTTILRKL